MNECVNFKENRLYPHLGGDGRLVPLTVNLFPRPPQLDCSAFLKLQVPVPGVPSRVLLDLIWTQAQELLRGHLDGAAVVVPASREDAAPLGVIIRVPAAAGAEPVMELVKGEDVGMEARGSCILVLPLPLRGFGCCRRRTRG